MRGSSTRQTCWACWCVRVSTTLKPLTTDTTGAMGEIVSPARRPSMLTCVTFKGNSCGCGHFTGTFYVPRSCKGLQNLALWLYLQALHPNKIPDPSHPPLALQTHP